MRVLAKAATGIGNLLLEGGASVDDERQQAMAGDRRAMARLLSKIENGSLALHDLVELSLIHI